MSTDIQQKLVGEVLRARERIYQVNKPTPLEKVSLPDIDATIYLKREDLASIKAYKWRGAYNCISMLPEEQRKKPIVAASAGNHAQGVALACRKMGLQARIYMPLTTPQMKQKSVKKHGGDNVEIVLIGDAYDGAAAGAKEYVESHDCAYIHPFDDIHTIAGQATIADEMVLSGKGPFDYIFLQIGGGGMAAGVSSWLKIHYPDATIIGVEGEGQASMKASIAAGAPTTLNEVDAFCDGTAVVRPGELCFEICKDTLDDVITVSNEEVCAAMETTWETGRFIPEPSGAMGLAGLIKYAGLHPDDIKGKKLATIICGANMDFSRLRLISARSAEGAQRRRYLRFHLDDRKGSLLELLEKHFEGINVSAFQYGKVDEKNGYPVIALETSAEKLEALTDILSKEGVKVDDITGQADVNYRIINYDASLFKNPLFMHIHFPERKGALRDLLKAISGIANICYFNYTYSGEAIGRALMGFEFETEADQQKFYDIAEESNIDFKELDDDTLNRIIYHAD